MEVDIDSHIVQFISLQTVLSLAVSNAAEPYSASCFYAFEPQNKLLVFKSDPETKHMRTALENRRVAGTILPDLFDAKHIHGIQFTGKLLLENASLQALAGECYYTKYPFAKEHAGVVWVVELDWIKMTDNALGFGKKITWQKTL